MKVEMLVLADDFTGALDTGMQFAKYGARTKVITDPDTAFSDPEIQILVIDTETRHKSPEESAGIISSIVKKASSCGVRVFYKKTDSALRGNVGAEMEALLRAAGSGCIHFVPAFPAMGRTVREGILYIKDLPVAESVFGRDPFEPVTTSSVAGILGRETSLPVAVRDAAGPDAAGIIVYNAKTDQDICRILEGLDMKKRPVILAGCAGLAGNLARRDGRLKDQSLSAWVPAEAKGLLVVCGSVNAVTRAQIRTARKAGFGYRGLTLSEKLTDTVALEVQKGLGRELCELADRHHAFLIDTNDLPGEETASDWGKARGIDIKTIGSRIADTLAEVVKLMLEHEVSRLLLLTGGDVLYHVMRELEVSELEPLAEVSPGVILSSFVFREKKRLVLTKSGGFGEEDLFVRIYENLRSITLGAEP